MSTELQPAVGIPSWIDAALSASADPGWCLTAVGYQPALEHETETRLAIGNGLLGVRGSLEIPTSASRPRTFVAGLFDTDPGPPLHSALVPGPDWLRLQITVDGTPVTLDSGTTLQHQRTLDLRRGVMLTTWQQQLPSGHTVLLRALRCVSLAHRALALQLVQLVVDQPAEVTLEARLEAPQDGLDVVSVADDHTVWQTRHSAHYLAVAAQTTLEVEGDVMAPAAYAADHAIWRWHAEPGQPALCLRCVAFTRRETRAAARASVRAALADGCRLGLAALLAAHMAAWETRWAAAEVVVAGDPVIQRALRFAVYQLICAAQPDDPQVSIGARALTGDAYQGHVFWDTEIFLLPFYSLTWPAAARALLLYRWRTLPAAREKARSSGWFGACFAWESTDTGADVTPTELRTPDGQLISIRNGQDELHVTAAVAYAVWRYWQVTQDDAFLLDAGAEILLETARYWASRATRAADGRYHLCGVIGPDEYHEGVDDNAYTNGMARWNIACGRDVAALLQARWPARWVALADRIRLTVPEMDSWSTVADGLVSGFDPSTGLFEQFAGYFGLAPIDLQRYADRTVPMDVILGREQTQRSQVIKQADVLMLLMLLWEQYPAAVRAANFAYYEPRCGHGSSLSPAVHALVAGRLGQLADAERYLRQAAAIDDQDGMGNLALGIHIATMGGLWQALVFGLVGLRWSAAVLHVDPQLPSGWSRLVVPLEWRGRRIRLEVVQPLALTVTLERGAPLPVAVGALQRTVAAGQSWCCRWDARTAVWQEVTR